MTSTAPVPHYLLPDSASVGADGRLSVGGCDLIDLATEYGTPLFVYDEDHLRARCREAVSAFGRHVAYASKAFLCRAMARVAHEEGMLIDVATGGEMAIALSAGVPAARLVLHGNNKSIDELRAALVAGIGRIVVDSFDELDRLGALHVEGLPVPDVLLRITPGVEAHTHEYVRTGQIDSKFGFGVSTGDAARAVGRALDSPAVRLVGLHAHIGSQVFDVGSFEQAVAVVGEFAQPYALPELSVGGGLGVAYVTGESAPSITDWASSVRKGLADSGLQVERLSAEPGRSIVASAAVTLYTVGTVKPIEGVRTYVSVDGGMSDNPRPVLYGSGYETFLPRAVGAARPRAVTLVGKHCESGDLLVRDARVPADLAVGDVLCTPVTGAYGASMASNYNAVLRPAVLFVSGGTARVVVRRETVDDLLVRDVG